MQRFRVAKNLLTQRLRRRPKVHPAIPMALQMFGSGGTGAAVQDVAREVGVCRRHFIQVFGAEVGLTPKLFCRVLRFQQARVLAEHLASVGADRVARAQVRSVLDWARLATTCGYFDQSHLIKDFEEFSGLSPADYLRERQPDVRLIDNHVEISR